MQLIKEIKSKVAVLLSGIMLLTFLLTPVVVYASENVSSGILSGVFVDQDNNPMSWISITLNDDEGNWYDIYSDENGVFYETLPTGQYWFRIYPSSYEYFVEDVSGVLEITENEAIEISRIFQKLPMGRISGYIKDTNDNFVENADVIFYSDSIGVSNGISTDESGFFDIQLPVAKYDLTVIGDGYTIYQSEIEIYEEIPQEIEVTLLEAASLSVLVTDNNNVPLERVELELRRYLEEDQYELFYEYTDEYGRFVFDGLDYTEYKLHINHERYESEIININISKKIEEIPIVLQERPIGIISGLIINEDGEALEGIEIVFVQEDEWGQNYYYTYTNEKGEFIGYLEQGNYYLKIYAHGYQDEFIRDINLEVGEHISFENIVLTRQSYGRVSGTVVNSKNNEPIENVEVMFDKMNENGVWLSEFYMQTDENATIDLHLKTGKYKVRFEHPNFKSEVYDLIVSEDEISQFNVSLVELDKITITGRVLDQNGQPLENAKIIVFSTPNDAITDENGAFSVDVFEGRNYSIMISCEGFWDKYDYVYTSTQQSVNLGDIRLDEKKIGQIKGRVIDKDGNPVVNVRVSAELEDDGHNYHNEVFQTDQYGYYNGDIYTGTYTIDICPSEQYMNFGHIISIQVTEGETVEVPDLIVDRKAYGYIEGVVRDQNNNIIPNARIELARHLADGSYEYIYEWLFSDENGYFRHKDLVGNYSVIISHESYDSVHYIDVITIVEDESQAIDAKLHLGPRGDVLGFIEDADGKPYRDVHIEFNMVGSNEWGSAGTDSKGQFSTSLKPGLYDVVISRWNIWPPIISQVVIEENKTLDLGRIALKNDGTYILTGKVVDTEGNPIPLVNIEVTYNHPLYQYDITHGETTTDENGQYTIEVAEGATITFWHRQYTLHREEIANRKHIATTLHSKEYGSLKIDVKDHLDNPVPYGQLMFINESTNEGFHGSLDENGKLDIELETGKYTVRSIFNNWSNYSTVEIKKGEVNSISERISLVDEAGVIKGRVLDNKGIPIRDSWVTVNTSINETNFYYYAEIDSFGFFTAYLPAVEGLEVKINSTNHKSKSFIVDITENVVHNFGVIMLNSDDDKYYGWTKINDEWYYFDTNSGELKTGWLNDSGKWYLLGVDGVMLTGWQQSGGKWYLLGADGVMLTGWQQSGGKWYLLGADGVMQTGWQQSGGKWYLLGSNGAMQTGWQQSGGKWYLLGSNGAMQTGWQQSGGKWYLLGSNGVMQTGWHQSGGKWYLLGSNGAMQTGWQQSGGKWYFLENSGAMVTGWRQISNNWYFFHSSGQMAANTTIEGYVLGSSGAWIR